MDVSIAIVNYNSCLMVLRCIHSVIEFCGDLDYEIIIVDNASSDDSVELIKASFPNHLLIENKKNLGFSKAVNQAFKVTSGKYFFLLNPDAKLISNIFPGMIEFFRIHPTPSVLRQHQRKNVVARSDLFYLAPCFFYVFSSGQRLPFSTR